MKHEYEAAVAFRRKDLREGDTVKVISAPTEGTTVGERNAVKRALGSEFTVIDGDEYGAIIQLDYFAPTWLDKIHLVRTA